jgi:hypothetical protein
MQITPMFVPFSPEALSSIAPSLDSAKEVLEVAEKWLHAACATVEIAEVLHTAEDAFMSVADFASTSVLGSLNFLATVSALHQCMEDGLFSMAGASALVHGFSALASLDQVLNVAAGVGLGLAEFSGVASVAVTLVTFAKQVHAGDVPGAVLSGAKLVATVALAGHPVALGIVLGANAAYALYSAYVKATEGAEKHAQSDHSAPAQADKPSSEPAGAPAPSSMTASISVPAVAVAPAKAEAPPLNPAPLPASDPPLSPAGR